MSLRDYLYAPNREHVDVLENAGLAFGSIGPRIIRGTGVPTRTDLPDSTWWVRDDATDASAAIYVSVGGVWTPRSAWTPLSATSCTIRGFYKGDVGYGGGSWLDQSGNGNDLTLTGTSASTSYSGHASVATSNGNRAVRASFSMGTTTGAVTLAWVGKVTGTHAGRLVMYSDALFNGEGCAVNGSNVAVGTNDIGADATGTTDLSTGVHCVITTKRNGGNQILYVGGVVEQSVTAITNDPADGEGFAIGCEAGNTALYSITDTLEAAAYNGEMSAAEAAKYAAYALTRYGT